MLPYKNPYIAELGLGELEETAEIEEVPYEAVHEEIQQPSQSQPAPQPAPQQFPSNQSHIPQQFPKRKQQ